MLKYLGYAVQIALILWLDRWLQQDSEMILAWGALLKLLAGLGSGAATYYGGQQAADQIPGVADSPFSGFDPRADPLLALLTADSSAGLGFAPDPNLTMAASPLNRLENSLTSSLGRGVVSSKELRRLNQAIQLAQAEFARGGTVDVNQLADAVENSFLSFRGSRGQDLFAAAQASVNAGVTDPNEIAKQMAAAEIGPYEPDAQYAADPQNERYRAKEEQNKAKYEEKLAAHAERLLPAIQEGVDQGLTGSDLSRHITNAFSEEKKDRAAGLFRTALTSAGFDDLTDLLTQEQSYRERAGVQQASYEKQASSRLGARESAQLTIDRLLKDYPAYGASDIERESQLALQPYQAQELETANMLGYNPATNLALTRTNGIRDALSILGGRQALTNTALGSLGTVLGSQTGQALAVSGQSQAALANAANIASQQALALQNLGLQGGMYQGLARGGALAGAGAIGGDALSVYADSLGGPASG